jgi:hypothetical protein
MKLLLFFLFLPWRELESMHNRTPTVPPYNLSALVAKSLAQVDYYKNTIRYLIELRYYSYININAVVVHDDGLVHQRFSLQFSGMLSWRYSHSFV